MKSPFRIPIAVIAVIALTIGLEVPQLFASSHLQTTATTDREALVALYQATDGDNWTNNRNWLDDAPVGTWHGVTTNQDNRVVELDLSDNELRGTIPSDLGNLTYLESLILAKNQLQGTIPSELGNLTYLEALTLYENQLRGSIPSELGSLSSLQVLALFENRLSGTVPPELAELNSLVWLLLSNNQLSGSIPIELGRLTNLNWLYLGGNRLSGSIPSELENLINLTELSLWGNELRGSIPPELGNLPNLEGLFLGNNRLSGWIPSELGNLGNLTSLSLWGNQLSGPFPPELENLSRLTLLYLADNRLTGCLPEIWRDVEENDLNEVSLQFCSDRDVLVALYEFTDGDNWLENDNWLSDAPLGTWYGVITDRNNRVVELDLSENELRGIIPTELGNLTKLEALSLAENWLHGMIPPELGNLTGLTLLYLYSNLLDGAIPTELGNLSKLEQLALSWNRLEGTIPAELGNLVHLEWLVLSGNRLRGTIPVVLGNLESLKVLALAENGLGGRISPQLAKLTGLEILYLADNELAGCLPESWRHVEENDLDEVGLPICTDKDVLIALYQATDGDSWASNYNWLSNDPIGTWYGVTTDQNDRVVELDLSDNKLKGTLPIELGNLPYLEILYLSENQLNGPIPAELGALSNLVELELWNNEVTGPIPTELSRLANLETLHLGDNQLNGPIPLELGKLANLEELGLYTNQLRGPIPPELGNLSNLVWMHLSDNRLTGPIPPELANLTFLTGLSLWGNRLSGTIPPELGSLTRLTMLGLARNNLDGDIPAELGSLSKLEHLYLADNRLSGCLPAIWENVEENDIERLDLPFCELTASTARATGHKLSSAQIFESVSPAIAFVHTWTGHGSGVLVEGGYIVTNAHVVWPYDTVRVVFPDGTDFRSVPVIGWDLLVDLAVLGPVDARVQPLPMLDGEQMSIGSEVYLIGYPAEVETYPETTMTRGILSRMREWEQVGITFFQTDAAITGGQSGGALVSDSGAVIGISGFRAFDEFGLAASSADILSRIRQLIAGRDPSGLGNRQLNLDRGSLRHRLIPRDYGDAYIFNEPPSTAVELEFFGTGAVTFQIVDTYGNTLADDQTGSVSFITRASGPHFLILSHVSGEIALSSNRQLVRFDDPDLGWEIQVGQAYHGNIDFPTDTDYYFLNLQRNEKVEIVVRSILADPQVDLWGFRGEDLTVMINDDDSGGGLFGLDARIVFQAPHTGEYVLHVENVHPSSDAPAGYVISVNQARQTDRLTPLSPWATITTRINVREGPGTNYAVIGTAVPGDFFPITGKSPGSGDWWQINYGGRSAWVYGPLVTAINAQDVQVISPP